MNLKNIRQNTLGKLLLNKYIWVGTFFVVWMVFLDTNSLLVHLEMNEEIEKLEKRRDYYKTEIRSDKKGIKALQQPFQIEEYARKEFFMKRPDEDIFIIEYKDSLKD